MTAGFGTADEVDAMAENAEVANARVLLANARARAEAIRHMDMGDFEGARLHVRSAVAASVMAYDLAPSPELDEELAMLRSELSDLDLRDADIMTRKKMMYAAQHRRKGR
jgi:hypothetical protein